MAVSASSSVQQARQVIADRLREIREQARLTGQGHARACGWDPAKTSRIEHNHAVPSAEDVRTWCRVCGADGEADDLVASLRTVEGMWVEWRRLTQNGLYQAQQARAKIRSRTRRYRCYQSWLIPGVLQTPTYAEAVLRSEQQRRGLIDDVDKALAARLERRQLLADPNRTFAFLIEESVLRSGVGGHHVLREQMDYLVDVATLPNVSLGLIPAGPDRSHWPTEGFWIYDATQVNVELISGDLTITQPREIEEYSDTFSEFAGLAVYGAEARRLITAAIDKLS